MTTVLVPVSFMMKPMKKDKLNWATKTIELIIDKSVPRPRLIFPAAWSFPG